MPRFFAVLALFLSLQLTAYVVGGPLGGSVSIVMILVVVSCIKPILAENS